MVELGLVRDELSGSTISSDEKHCVVQVCHEESVSLGFGHSRCIGLTVGSSCCSEEVIDVSIDFESKLEGLIGETSGVLHMCFRNNGTEARVVELVHEPIGWERNVLVGRISRGSLYYIVRSKWGRVGGGIQLFC